MTSSATEICNLASDLVSGGIMTNVETPTTAEESLYNRWYNKSRRKVLRAHPWNFATKRALLAASSTDPEFEYSSQYTVPSDLIRLLELQDDNGNNIPRELYDFEDGNILYDGDAPLRLRYIYDITDVLKMDDMFIDLLIYEIALGVVFKVGDSNTDVERIVSLRDKVAAKAKAVNGQENPPDRVEYSNNISVRKHLSNRRSDRVIF